MSAAAQTKVAPINPLVVKFAPWLGYDNEAAGNGYPMSPQKFRDQIDIVNKSGATDNRKGGFKQDGISSDESYIQNLDIQTLKNGATPTYFQ